MALYGKNLAATIHDGATWNQLMDVCHILADGLTECYSSLDLWDNWKKKGTVDTVNLAIFAAISPQDRETIKGFLDTDLASVQAFWTVMLEYTAEKGMGLDEPADKRDGWDPVGYTRSLVERASDTIATVDRYFHTSIVSEVTDAVIPVAGTTADWIAALVSKVLGNFLGGIWWIIALAVVVLVLWSQRRSWMR